MTVCIYVSFKSVLCMLLCVFLDIKDILVLYKYIGMSYICVCINNAVYAYIRRQIQR